MKKKHFELLAKYPRLERIAQSELGLLLINWLMQGMRGMDRKELSFRLLLLAGLTVVLYGGIRACIGASLPWAGLLSLTLAHTANWTFNGQIWVCLRYWRIYIRDSARLSRQADEILESVRQNPNVADAVVIGSYYGQAGNLGPRSDLDLRLFFSEGVRNYCMINLYLLYLRSWAFFLGFPLDLYAYDSIESLKRFNSNEGIYIVKGQMQRSV